ncbi:YqaJ viral recombinase family protein [Thiomicrorhabdus aquaedulcis]|uniref:YqaJ viral recombinase family protein n=1 Tax=Thiomicrorhabdus aquaedulcis TaxID=2211106 RepID=UPI000FDA9F74|nr:YqaJ viral recombinase family protein [Thiomicrorhabdus aquaedulcis]
MQTEFVTEFVNLVQGSLEWLEFRKNHYPASEAPSMMGESKFEPLKPEDLALIRLGLKAVVVSDYQQTIFDNGHETEECARPLVAMLINEPLANTTCRMNVPSLSMMLSASLDGITFDGDTLFEHKQWNESLAEDVRNKSLTPAYTWQLEQQLLVSGAKKVIFVTSDAFKLPAEDLEQFRDSLVTFSEEQIDEAGVRFHYAANHFEYMEYTPQPGKAQELIKGWENFEQTVAEVLVDNDVWASLADEYLAAKKELDVLMAQKDAIESRMEPFKKALINSAKSAGSIKMIGSGVEVSRMTRKGGLDEKSLLQFMSAEELDSCRKAESSSWQVKAAKNKPTPEQIKNAKAIQAKHGNKQSNQVPAVMPNRNVMEAGLFNF